ncbi:MAG: phosphate transport system regulatory protein PhoU [Deltaproteobacteria bacterium RBG_13_60_28]|jgi:phosphate transport system protein|nr:MAG: phosphate transport system regulatory protein PhoU [Deltaproteobacteria bacterium RBG_13_60_28]
MKEEEARRDKLHQELEALKGRLLELGEMAQKALDLSIAAFWDRNTALARQVVVGDKAINDLEVAIDGECVRLVALYQPVAIDLRVIMAVDHIIAEMERIGDQAVNMAEEGVNLARYLPPPLHPEILTMARKVQEMVVQSLEAFISRDVPLARQVCRADDEVDGLDRKITQELLEHMAANQEVVPADYSQINIVRNLERVGDHATNIAEQVIYMVEGENVRHRCQG